MPLTITTQKEIRKKTKDKLWDIKAAYSLDCDKIRKWIKENARASLTADDVGTFDAKKIEEHADIHYPSLSNELEELYKVENVAVDEKIFQEAKDGIFKQKVPSVSGIFAMLLVLVAMSGFEMAFFIYMVFLKDASGGLIGLGIALLVGGIFTGLGVTEIALHGTRSKYIGTEDKVGGFYIGLLVAGIILIAAVTTIRWMAAGFLGGMVAVLFGLGVTTSEVVFEYKLLLRIFYLNQMFRAQEYYAATNLRKDLGNPKTHKDDKWLVEYTACINSIVKTGRDTASLA